MAVEVDFYDEEGDMAKPTKADEMTPFELEQEAAREAQVAQEEDRQQPLNGPTDQWLEDKCAICGAPLRARVWMLFGRRMHANVHERCVEQRFSKGGKTEAVEIPERFRQWDFEKFCDKHAFSQAQSFDPDAKFKVLALLGDPGKGKSRLMWQIIRQFFELWRERQQSPRWVDYFHFSDLMTEYDQAKISKIKISQFVFIDDLTAVPISRTSTLIQEVIRHRVTSQKWTFLTIDSEHFDPDLLKNVFRERAVTVKVK